MAQEKTVTTKYHAYWCNSQQDNTAAECNCIEQIVNLDEAYTGIWGYNPGYATPCVMKVRVFRERI